VLFKKGRPREVLTRGAYAVRSPHTAGLAWLVRAQLARDVSRSAEAGCSCDDAKLAALGSSWARGGLGAG